MGKNFWIASEWHEDLSCCKLCHSYIMAVAGKAIEEVRASKGPEFGVHAPFRLWIDEGGIHLDDAVNDRPLYMGGEWIEVMEAAEEFLGKDEYLCRAHAARMVVDALDAFGIASVVDDNAGRAYLGECAAGILVPNLAVLWGQHGISTFGPIYLSAIARGKGPC